MAEACDPNDPYDSPCVRICVIDQQSRYCAGCGRTLHEISYWTRYSPDERKAILGQLPARLSLVPGTGTCL